MFPPEEKDLLFDGCDTPANTPASIASPYLVAKTHQLGSGAQGHAPTTPKTLTCHGKNWQASCSERNRLRLKVWGAKTRIQGLNHTSESSDFVF